MARVTLSLADDRKLPAKLFSIWQLFATGSQEVTLVIPDERVELGKDFEKDDFDLASLEGSSHE